ncbi:Trimethyllysine dioxygenase [Vanrija pseudolonga]|uniref:trimethyllysine dioxygenase n=1 Tax=Vanrija pseudolonga TaxID=143232 RepID=A0AAF0YH59_9TREE|nr:Trimethyllysine dioxygenase [Vanrija pseudolonga]
MLPTRILKAAGNTALRARAPGRLLRNAQQPLVPSVPVRMASQSPSVRLLHSTTPSKNKAQDAIWGATASLSGTSGSPQIVINWADGPASTFDTQYLYDHCRCPSCFHPKTKQRLKTLGPVASDVAVSAIEVKDGQLHVSWNTAPGHESSFPLSFLRQASYDPPLADRFGLLDQTPQTFWGSTIAAKPPTVTYDSVMPNIAGEDVAENGVLDWLNKVYEFGFCFVTGVPATGEATEELIRRMGHIRETHYGGFWDFTADMSKGDLAYSNLALPAHTDTAYFTDPAGLQIFHCLSHLSPPGTGGETLLVDAFYVASQLRERNPEAFETLARLPVPFHASGNEGTILRPPIDQPVLRLDQHGLLAQARWNNEDRCVLGDKWTPQDITQWYDAARLFESICTSPEAEYWVKLKPGTVVVIDNWRVMHGRAAFTGQRRMCGAYVGADDWKSRRRALKKVQQQKTGEDDVWRYGW